jgi:hypothetical protein
LGRDRSGTENNDRAKEIEQGPAIRAIEV